MEKNMKKFVSLACAGVLTFGAASTVNAAPNSGTSNVTYISGAINADTNGTSDYYVVLPANITFANEVKSISNYDIELLTKEGVLPGNLNVEVKAKSQNGVKLLDATKTSDLEGEYTVTWDGANNPDAGAVTLTGTADVSVALFNFDNSSNAQSVATLTQTGTANIADEVVTKLEKAKRGTKFTDVITFTITDSTPTATP